MLKRIADQLVNVYALIWAIGYCCIADPVKRWYTKHRFNADYFAHMGWLVGLLVSIIMILWGTAQ